jgi:hypothetical protein
MHPLVQEKQWMAWFENNDKINIQQTQKRTSTWKKLADGLTFLKKIPFVNSLYQYFVQRNIHKKLDQIESKIASSPMEDFQTVLSLYKLLFQETHKSLHQDNNGLRDTSLSQRIPTIRYLLISKWAKVAEQNGHKSLPRPIIAEETALQPHPNNFSWRPQKANSMSQSYYYLFWQQNNSPKGSVKVISEEQQSTKGPSIHST